MATPSSYEVFKPQFKKTIIDAIYQEVTSGTATYYHWLGKENAWTDFLSPFISSNTIDAPGAPSNNFRYDLHVRRDILTTKKIKPSDVSYVVRRIDWVSNTVYDDYDDAYEPGNEASSGATSLEEANFYVLTSEFNVYKCIWNNYGAKSTQMPTGTTTSIFSTADGYKWKFMYSIPVSLRNRFLTAEYMPVSNALKAAYYSNGELYNISIQNGGTGYNPATTTAIVTGDGYKANNPYLLQYVVVDFGGEGYTSTPTVTVTEPFPSAVEWESEAATSAGSYIKYVSPLTLKTNFYYVESGTELGTTGPIHTTGTTTNGNCQLRYAGTTAEVSANMSGDSINTIDLDSAGFGYSEISDPVASVIFEPPFEKDANWTPLTGFSLGSIIFYRDLSDPENPRSRYYEVTTAGTSGTTPPTHESGTVANGAAQLLYLGADPEITVFVEKTNAEISLIISPRKDSVFNVIITRPGTKYTEVPVVTIDAPGTGIQATAEATVENGSISFIEVTAVGNGYISAPLVSIGAPYIKFNSIDDVNDAADTITYTGHRLVTGDAVIYDNGGGTSIGGLTDGLTYYIIKVNDNTIRLASSLVNANAGTYLPITDGVGAAHTLTLTGDPIQIALATATLGTGGEIVGYEIVDPGIGYTNANIQVIDTNAEILFDGVSAVSPVLDTITIPTHNLITGTEVIYTSDGGTDIDPLVSDISYYVIRIDPNTIKLALTPEDAVANNYIDILNDGSAGDHKFTVVGAGSGAILVPNFNIGDVETIQANVELLAVPGSIETIKMVNGGVGYGTAQVQILGDGTGATAIARCVGGKVVDIQITNPGSGYTWTDVIITTTSPGASGAVARAIMSPINGHGSDAIDELAARSIVFYTSISRDLNQGFDINNDYRKAGLVRNLKKFGSNERFIEDIGSGCVKIFGTFDKSKLQYDMLLYKSEGTGNPADDYKKYRIVDFDDTSILLSVFNNFTINPGDTLRTDPTNAGAVETPTVLPSTITVTSRNERTIDQFSGDFLFFSVRETFAPSAEQIITVRTTLSL